MSDMRVARVIPVLPMVVEGERTGRFERAPAALDEAQPLR
jgi:hypothetical protein